MPKWFMGVFGGEFRGGALVLVLVTIGQFVNCFSGSVGYFLSMTGAQRVFRNISMAALSIKIVTNLLLIPHVGVVGAACSSAIVMAFSNIVAVAYVRRRYGINMMYLPVPASWRRGAATANA
jgi:O-antigen/teichoic acid export membrane protein